MELKKLQNQNCHLSKERLKLSQVIFALDLEELNTPRPSSDVSKNEKYQLEIRNYHSSNMYRNLGTKDPRLKYQTRPITLYLGCLTCFVCTTVSEFSFYK